MSETAEKEERIMALFISTYINKVDKKGRVSVPAPFRAVLSTQNFNGIAAYASFVRECIEASGIDRIERLSQTIDDLNPFSEEQDAFATSILSECVQLPFDSDGRILLPEKLIKAANITDRAAFVGKGKTFEIWQPELFEVHAAKAREIARSNRNFLAPQTRNDGGSQ